MRCVCKYSRNIDIPNNIMNNNGFIETVYDLSVGMEYRIFGQSMFKEKLSYLIDPRDDSTPSWYPAELFYIIDSTVPLHWEFQFFPEASRDSLGAIWGYPELVHEESHYDDLYERVPEALLIFARHKLMPE